MGNFLITGATGFIGRAVVHAALAQGHSVTALVRAPKFLPPHPKLTLMPYKGLEDFSPDSALGQTHDGLIHLAWANVGNYMSAVNLKENLEPQFAFLGKMAKAGIRNITVAGTCLEYGMQTGALNETLPAAPVTEYAKAKHALHQRLLEAHPNLALKWLRYFYVYGEGQREQSLYAQLMAAIARGDKEFAMSPGDQERDFIHIDTLAHNTVVIAAQNMSTGIFNIGNGRALRVLDFVEAIMRAKNHRMKLRNDTYPYPAYEPMSFAADTSKLKTIPGVRFDAKIIV